METLGLSGLVAAPHTPFAADGGLLLSSVDRQAELLVDGGVSAAFVCGTTGEGLSLSTAERMKLAERWVQAAGKALPVIAHVGHTSVVEAKALAAHAQEAGAAAISAMAPCFFKPATVPDLVDFCAAVAAAAPGLPFYYYHLPSMTGVALPMPEFMGRARERIPTFAGVKFTHNDLAEFKHCLELAGDDLDVLFGRDEILLAGLAAGARGAIGSTYNYAAPLFARMIAAFKAGDLTTALRLQSKAERLVAVLRKYGEIAAAKTIMTMIGVDCGPVRTPLANLCPDRVRALLHDLEGLDIFTRPLGPAAR